MIVLALALAAVVNPQAALPARFTDLALGMKKAELTERLGGGQSLVCSPVRGAEVPTHDVEACHNAEGAFLIARRHGEEPRLIAYSVTAPAEESAGVAASLSGRLGRPLRVLDTAWGRSTVWLQAGRQISFREACAPGRACLEVSGDAFARRVARSTGLFVPATPGT